MSGISGEVPLTEVRLEQLPVELWARSQEHFAELTREFALIAASGEEGRTHVPARLLEMVDNLTAEYGEFSVEQERELHEAAQRGAAAISLVFRVPAGVEPAIDELETMLDEADEFCRSGEHLLTLETPEPCVQYRHWYLGQFRDQLRGEPAVGWPDWAGSTR